MPPRKLRGADFKELVPVHENGVTTKKNADSNGWTGTIALKHWLVDRRRLSRENRVMGGK